MLDGPAQPDLGIVPWSQTGYGASRAAATADRIAPMPDRLYFTDSDEANELIAEDPMALLIGFALDQQVTVQKAFSGPLAMRERVGTLDPAKLAATDLEPVFREKPAIHRFPGKMAERVHDLSEHVRDDYDGDAARVWTRREGRRRAAREPRSAARLRRDEGQGARLGARQALQAREGRKSLVPPHPTLGDVDSPQALLDYQAAKKAHKAEWSEDESGG